MIGNGQPADTTEERSAEGRPLPLGRDPDLRPPTFCRDWRDGPRPGQAALAQFREAQVSDTYVATTKEAARGKPELAKAAMPVVVCYRGDEP